MVMYMYVHVCLLMYMQLPGDGKSPYQEYYIYGPFGGGGWGEGGGANNCYVSYTALTV